MKNLLRKAYRELKPLSKQKKKGTGVIARKVPLLPVAQKKTERVLRTHASAHKSIPSADSSSTIDATARKEKNIYSGTAVLGIALMHKSNYVPVTSGEAAIEVTRMRRG
jgi:hypothetical protein